jgi:glucose-6-phosphate isomerase
MQSILTFRALNLFRISCFDIRVSSFNDRGVSMCPTRIRAKLQPIELDLSPALFFEQGWGRADLLQFGPRLEQARTNVLAAAKSELSFIAWPQWVLNDYRAHRKFSLLGSILTTARRLRETVDRVVVIGPPRMVLAARALLAAGGHPYHNELTRGQRGERPRIYLLPAVADNDAVQGLLDILPQGRLLRSLEERWGLVALDWQSDEEDESHQLTLGLFHLFWDALQKTTTATEEPNLAAVVGPKSSPLHALAESLGIAQIITDTSHRPPTPPPAACRIPPTADCFHPGVLLTASLMGIDVVNLLIGAAAMNDRFATSVVGDNPALDLAGLCHLLAERREIDRSIVTSPTAALNPLGDLLSRGGRSEDALLVQCLPERVRADRLRVTMPADGAGDSKKRIVRSLPDIAVEEFNRLRDARAEVGRPTAVVRLRQLDELSLGQLIQMFLIADVIEQQLGAKPQAVTEP